MEDIKKIVEECDLKHVAIIMDGNRRWAKNNGVIKIKVGETSNYLVSLAHCCQPKPGDEIIGYVSRGRGIIVHKVNCPNFAHIPNIDVRNINVEWDE